MEVIRRAGLHDFERNILLAEQWVVSRQDTIGLWFEKGSDAEFLSVVICEYFRDRDKFQPLPQGLLTVTRGFLRRAEELALDPSSDAARLAVVSAFHGVEMFLYGIAADDRFTFDIYEKSGNTIGLRGALSQLRDRLREQGLISETSELRWITQMKAIASLRDQIVHKGHEVTSETAFRQVSEAVDFVIHYGEKLLQLQILDK
jgi:hypothetical protein